MSFRLGYSLCLLVSLVLVLPVFSETQNGWFLDVDEIQSIEYDVTIQAKPVRKDIDKTSNTFPLVNKFGQLYYCQLPATATDEDEDSLGATAANGADSDGQTTAEKGEKETIAAVPASTKDKIQSLLSPLKTKPCLFRTKDWWTYEFCYAKHILQYHVEDGKTSGKVLNLGVYDSDYAWEDDNEQQHQSDEADKGTFSEDEKLLESVRQHRQFYNNGTKCDLTGKPRKSEVRFICNPSSVVDVLVSVEEPSSCEYILTVSTSRICTIPQLKPPPKNEPRLILCSPALSDAEFEKYSKYEEAKKELETLKKEEAKIKQKDRMLEVLSGEDLSKIDVHSEEGIKTMEAMVQEKMVEGLVTELEKMFNPSSSIMHKVLPGDLLGLGRKQSKKATFQDVIDKVVKELQTKAKLKTIFKSFEEQLGASHGQEKAATAKKETKETEKPVQEKDSKQLWEESFLKNDKEQERDLELDRRVRSDVVSHEEMVDDLYAEMAKAPGGSSKVKAYTTSKEFREQLLRDLDDIVKESEAEVGAKLEPSAKEPMVEEHVNEIKQLIQKLEKTESELARVKREIEDVQKVLEELDEREKQVKDPEKEHLHDEDLDIGERKDLKHDNKRSVKKELREEEFYAKEEDDNIDESLSPIQGDSGSDHVQVQVNKISATSKVSSLSSGSTTDEKITKRLETVLKDKLKNVNLDTGGRQIEVKLITTGFGADDLSGDDDDSPSELTMAEMEGDEGMQFQGMLYNLMMGNQEAFNDIDQQRRTERNYKFSWDDGLLERTEKATQDKLGWLRERRIESGATSKVASSSNRASGDDPEPDH